VAVALWKRKISLMIGVATGATVLALLGDSLSLGHTVTVAIAGAALALVIVLAGPWAFGEGRFAFEERNPMQSHQAAVIAGQQQGGEAPPNIQLVVIETMENYLSVERSPIVGAAGPAGSEGPFTEGEAEFVEVGNGVGHEK
jgi:hypothetical protein